VLGTIARLAAAGRKAGVPIIHVLHAYRPDYLDISLALVLAFAVQMATVWVPRAGAASDPTLAPNLSFDDDSSRHFPIQGQNLSTGSTAGEATMIFWHLQLLEHRT